MSLVTFDGHSFLIDGRRIWLVSGSMPYARIPRQCWSARIDAARRAGLNCLSVDAPWFLHEPASGKFDFEGDLDIRAYIGLIAECGMACILRPGPHLGNGWDGGALPAWLTADPTVTPRSTHRQHPRFLEATGRYFAALMDQVRDLQATSTDGGPILLMQAEREWFCDPPETHASYLEELLRHLREHGCEVPVTMANNMWTRVDGTIDTWNARDHLATDLRQLPIVQPNAPRIISEFACAPPQPVTDTATPMSPSECQRKLAEILSAGAQYNLHLFHGGTSFGFHGGTHPTGGIYGATAAPAAPLAEDGHAGALMPAVKSISTFASQFSHVLAHLDQGPFHVAAAPSGTDHAPSVMHQRGSQGDVVFVIRSASDRRDAIDLMLPNGLTLPVPLGDDTVAWVLLNANLGAIELNYTSLRPWAWIAQRLLVLFGPAGMTGHLSVDDATMTVTVPKGQRPVVEQHEDTHIVVLNHAQMAVATPTPDGLVIGVDGDDRDGRPIKHSNWKTATHVALDGTIRALRLGERKPGAPPQLSGWEHTIPNACLDGNAPFTPLEGPTSLADAGCLSGYGWYTLDFSKPWSGRALPGDWGDRVHLYRDGHLETLWGQGPGAKPDPFVFKASGRILLLTEALGRPDGGSLRPEIPGLTDHLYAVKAVRLGRAVTPTKPPPDPFDLGGYVPGLRAGDLPEAGSYAWRVAATGSQPLIVEVGCLPQRALLTVNGIAIALCLPGMVGGRFVLRSGQHLRRRPNEIRLAFFDEKPPAGAVTAAVKIYQTVRNLTDTATWSFSPWQVPGDGAFGPMPSKFGAVPRWFRCQIAPPGKGGPLWLDVSSMSKGQVFLNGRHLCRYFSQTAARRRVGKSHRCHLPEPWLETEGPNTLMLFDEHGFKPTNCRLHRHEN